LHLFRNPVTKLRVETALTRAKSKRDALEELIGAQALATDLKPALLACLTGRESWRWTVGELFERLNRGEDTKRNLKHVKDRVSGLNLLVAAIILWNTTYLQRAVDHLRNQGYHPASGDMAHLSPFSCNTGLQINLNESSGVKSVSENRRRRRPA
jgi:hypothetical protein